VDLSDFLVLYNSCSPFLKNSPYQSYEGEIVMKINFLFIFILFFITLFPATGSASSSEKYSSTWWKIAFDTPMRFSPPRETGLEAASFLYPPDSSLGKAGMEISVVAVPKEMQEAFANNDTEILEYVKTTFLALSGPAKAKTERKFLGKICSGESHSVTVPKNTVAEVYLLSLADGDKVAVGFVRDGAMPENTAEKIMATVAGSLKEVAAGL
jgi:hypothetical protein